LALDFDLTISACRNNVGHIMLIAAQQTLFIPAVSFALNEEVAITARAALQLPDRHINHLPGNQELLLKLFPCYFAGWLSSPAYDLFILTINSRMVSDL
jgi:hypothetical protein